MRKAVQLCAAVLAAVMLLCSCAKKAQTTEMSFDGKVVAVSSGSLAEKAAAAYKASGATIESFSELSDAVFALKGGRVDYVAAEEYEAYRYVRANDDLTVSGKLSFSMEYAACFYRNDKLQKAFNEAIEALKADGTIDAICKSYREGKAYAAPTPTSSSGTTLTMVTNATREPFDYTDKDGNVAGLEIDIAKEICARLGVGLNIVNEDFEQLMFSLSKKKADFAMSGITVNEQRKKAYQFSEIYLTSYQVFLCRK